MQRVIYKCKKCNWGSSLPKEWADLRPKLCGNKKCRTSFIKNPKELDIIMPPKDVELKVDKTEEQVYSKIDKKHKKERIEESNGG